MLLYAINFIIRKIKKKDYELDPQIKSSVLLSIIFERIDNLLRGTIKKIGVKSNGKIIFVGKNVTLKNKRYIEFGNGVTLENNVVLDGLSREGLLLGNNVKIGSYTIIQCTGSLKHIGKGFRIGDNSGVGDYCFFGSAGGIKIGENVIMGQNVRFHSENHIFDRIDIPIREQGVNQKGIVVGDDCWIGAGVVFLDGVTVGRGCVIGANTLVNKDLPPYSIAVGNPVRVIKHRNKLESRAE